MKRSLFLLSLFSLVYIQLNAQENPIKSFPLNEYIAPDIKYRALDLSAYFNSSGSHVEENKNYSNYLYLNGDLLYYTYSNTQNHQGINSSNLLVNTNFGFGKADTNKAQIFRSKVYLDYFSQNRVYYKNNVFWGFHGGGQYEWNGSIGNAQDLQSTYNINELSITPYISIGKGRVQPISSARKAQDILLSLEEYGRLKRTPTPLEIDSLARIANKIRYKRFYDSRFKRIYQLEELDKALQGMGLIDSADIVYFANLSDIWSFARNRTRGSGTRFEGGIIPQFSIYNQVENDFDRNDQSPQYFSSITLDYGAYGFFSYNRFKAISYSWQSDLFIDITFGRTWSEKNWEERTESSTTTGTSNKESWNGLVNLSWQLGYIPNTRTSLTLTPYASFSYGISHSDKEIEKIGSNTGFIFNSYYYVSPRFRINVSANFAYYSNFTNNAPAPFWNTISYHSDSRYYISNDVVQNQRSYWSSNITARNGYDYSFRFAITYALF